MDAGDSELTGGWCWFQEPRVLATRDATFIGWTEYDEAGTISVARFDHERRTFEINRGVGITPGLAPDDHNAPALYRRNDGRVSVFYTAHNCPDGNRYRTSEEPDSVDAFGSEQSIPDVDQSTYPMPVRLADPGELVYLYRDAPADGSPSTFYYYRSPDEGETWSTRRRLFEIEGDDYSGYVKVDAGHDRIDVCFSRHPRPAPLEKCDVQHFYYDATREGFRDSHGNPIPAPVRERDMTTVFDAAETGERGWIWDVCHAGEKPAIVFSSFVDGDERDQRYYHARYDGGDWRVTEIVETDYLYATNREGEANELEYAPGICFGREDHEVYLSRSHGSRDDRSRGLHVEEWSVGADHDARRERVVARGDERNQFRPVVPRYASPDVPRSPVRAVWMCDQSRAPYYYHDPEETLKLRAEIETGSGTETVRMDDWAEYGRSG